MAKISHKDIAFALFLASRDKTGAELEDIFHKAVRFLHRRHLLSKAPDILSYFKKIINKEHGVLEAHVSSPAGLHEATKKELAQFLKKNYSVQEVDIFETYDETLMAGFKVEVNSEVIDLTLKKQLSKLEEHLKTNA